MEHLGFISLLPAIVALGLAIWSKRVIESLLAGIFTGILIVNITTKGFFTALLFSINNTFSAIAGYAPKADAGLKGMGLIKSSGRAEIIIVVLLLGAFITILEKSGGAYAFGEWLSNKIRSKKGSQNATAIMGCSLFTSAYFSSLATGTVFKPIFDKHKLSRARLAFILDSTSAPINVLIPISGWVAYMAILMEENIATISKGQGMIGIAQTVPFNFYCLIILGVVFLFANNFIRNLGPMKKAEDLAQTGEELTTDGETVAEEIKKEQEKKGQVSDMLLPLGISVLMLIVLGLWNYTIANFFKVPKIPFGGNQMLIVSFTLGILVGGIKYIASGLMTAKEFLNDALEGTKSAVIGGMIIILAVTLGDVLRAPYPEGLGAITYLKGFASYIPGSIVPFGVFAVASFMGFSMGTSWGVWAIMMPIGISLTVATGGGHWAQILTAAAVLSGGTFGDHCSPISDTTIMSSIGAGCDHMEHVNTQLPYALIAAAIASVFFLVFGFIL